MAVLLYATDEDLALAAGGDWPELVPRDLVLAEGSDGAFLAGDPWTLTSAATNFAVQVDLAPPPATTAGGQVVAGTFPGPAPVILLTGGTPAGLGTNTQLVIAAAAGAAATLRRKGLPAGAGAPPGGASGRAGVQFQVRTLGPQVEDASYDLDRRYSVDDFVFGRRASDEYDPRELRRATVLTVLARQYLAMSREKDDAFSKKAAFFAQQLVDLLDRVAVDWLPRAAPQGSQAHTGRFSTRVTR